jgi:MmyB-like transcription regulator ligand binding domain
MWRDQEVGPNGKGVKRIEHPTAGALTFEYATFAVDEQPDLGLVVFTPATPADTAQVKKLVQS